jgi:hypothetical protein
MGQAGVSQRRRVRRIGRAVDSDDVQVGMDLAGGPIGSNRRFAVVQQFGEQTEVGR